MEMLVIAVIAVVAFAAVLVPLFRRRPGYGDESEFENIPSANPARAAAPSPRPTTTPEAESTKSDAQSTKPDAESTKSDAESTSPAPDAASTDDELELEVQRYRAAVRADTICAKCGQANPADSTYCFECGAGLPRADAREFE